MPENNNIRPLINLAGKVLFVIGLVLNVLMIFFGFWPSLVFLLIMLAGAGMFSLNRDVPEINIPENIIRSVAPSLKIVFITLLAVIAGGVLLMLLTRNYSKASTTRNDCSEISASLNSYYQHHKKYPGSLDEIIGINPLRRKWNQDGWGNPYRYNTGHNVTSFTLVSPGKDGKFDSGDDIVVKQAQRIEK
ncbi:type II secretion system protein GspG [Chitinophaga barathri]|uniref:Type II secretion system protein GspG C-terminal domain-containing protein n=1 Tax=Chitinophaga barathri TaxID=1647451 RepID=A0A3N4N412_9BACT|nr:type II secretion system protein GspG [Chitinophaga barathri]RPD42373.1 hypothetical protein EG028_04130 [Chitinophaga barathri]